MNTEHETQGSTDPTKTDIALDTPVTTVIVQRPLKDAVSRYEAWLQEIVPAAQQFAGHQSVNVIRPHAGDAAYTIILHFDTIANLRAWLDSDTRARLIEKIRPFLHTDENIEIKTGVEFWFTPPAGGRTAPPYKQFLITLSAIFPLTIIIPWMLGPAFGLLPALALPGIRHFVIAALIVGAMTYIIMPRYTRLVAGWLYGVGRK